MNDDDIRNRAIPIEQLVSVKDGKPVLKPGTKELFRQATFVVGLDVRTNQEDVFFGRKMLKDIIDTGRGQFVRKVVVSYDAFTDELELLAAVCVVTKGYHDYVGDPHFLDH